MCAHMNSYTISLMAAMGNNFARQGVATQISYTFGAPHRAIDGNHDDKLWRDSCSITRWEKSPWWMVTFAELITVRQVIITSNSWYGEYMASY